jgi:hypothetical protein
MLWGRVVNVSLSHKVSLTLAIQARFSFSLLNFHHDRVTAHFFSQLGLYTYPRIQFLPLVSESR